MCLDAINVDVNFLIELRSIKSNQLHRKSTDLAQCD